jgi:flagellar biosynthesis anti-sigma factor FlgM
MKIDPRIPYTGETQQPENVKNTRTTGAASQSTSKSGGSSGLAPTTGEDTVSLSSTHGEVQSLTAAVGNVPDVRTDRVAALQQQISKDQYQPSSQNVADAIIKEYSKASAKA